MEGLRRSRRLQNLAPEIETLTVMCFICHITMNRIDSTVYLLSCCSQMVHRACHLRWLATNQHNPRCGLCRRDLPGVDPQPLEEPPQNRSRDEVLVELRRLLPPEVLHGQLLLVSVLYNYLTKKK